MKKRRFAVEQIFAVFKEAEAGMPVLDFIRQGCDTNIGRSAYCSNGKALHNA